MSTRGDDSVAQFRKWIIERLKESMWIRFEGERIAEVAVRLGIQPELLREAQASLAEDARAQGREVRVIGMPRAKLRRGGRSWVDLTLPKLVHEHWTAYCARREIPEAVLLRSLVHRLLMVREPPSHIRHKRWVYRGRQLPVCQDRARGGRGRYLTSVAAEVTPGAKQALVRRARALGVGMTALVRGAIIDLLEGRTKHLAIVGTVGQMWDDPDRYWRETE